MFLIFCEYSCTLFDLHQLIPVLPRNSPVSGFQKKRRNPSQPCFTSGFWLKLNCFISSFFFLSSNSSFLSSLTLSVLTHSTVMVSAMFGVSTTDVLSSIDLHARGFPHSPDGGTNTVQLYTYCCTVLCIVEGYGRDHVL